MTQEEKQELIVALCGYLPYKCKGKYEIVRILESETKIERFDDELDSNVLDYDFEYENFKPYLRPMSSMTEEEKDELKQISSDYLDKWVKAETSIERWKLDGEVSFNRSVFYNSHHLDWIGLIPMGLALEAEDGMYTI